MFFDEMSKFSGYVIKMVNLHSNGLLDEGTKILIKFLRSKVCELQVQSFIDGNDGGCGNEVIPGDHVDSS